jgi:hypothetical protein
MKRRTQAELSQIRADKNAQEGNSRNACELCHSVLGVTSSLGFEKLPFERRMGVCVNMLALLETWASEDQLSQNLLGRLYDVVAELWGCQHLSMHVCIMAASLLLYAGETFSLGML